MYTVTTMHVAYNAAAKLAKGCYQAALLAGSEAWSGATLQGKARSYGDRYKASRNNLVRRLEKAGIPHHFELVGRGRRITLILGTW